MAGRAGTPPLAAPGSGALPARRLPHQWPTPTSPVPPIRAVARPPRVRGHRGGSAGRRRPADPRQAGARAPRPDRARDGAQLPARAGRAGGRQTRRADSGSLRAGAADARGGQRPGRLSSGGSGPGTARAGAPDAPAGRVPSEAPEGIDGERRAGRRAGGGACRRGERLRGRGGHGPRADDERVAHGRRPRGRRGRNDHALPPLLPAGLRGPLPAEAGARAPEVPAPPERRDHRPARRERDLAVSVHDGRHQHRPGLCRRRGDVAAGHAHPDPVGHPGRAAGRPDGRDPEDRLGPHRRPAAVRGVPGCPSRGVRRR